MRGIIAILIVLITPMIVHSNIDTIYYTAKWKETKSRKKAEFYRVFDLLPNGVYQCKDYYRNNSIQMIGYYKDRQCTQHDSIFEYYTREGLLSSYCKFRDGKFVFAYENVIINEVISDTLFLKIDTMVVFHDGEDDIKSFLINNLRYPDKAKALQINGVVGLSFIIDETGQISDIKIVKGIGFGCDEAAIEVVKRMSLWNPGVYNGRKVKCKFYLPIRFTYQ